MLKFKFSLLFLIILFISSCDEATPGCMDSSACNFNSSATEDDGTCTYAQEPLDCDGNCTLVLDCAGNCGGSFVIDDCDQCVKPEDENITKDCAGVCDGDAEYDCLGVCDGDAVYDDCGICNGDNYYTNDLLPNGACNCWAVTNITIDVNGTQTASVTPEYQYLDDCNKCGGDGIDCNLACCSSWHEERCKVMMTGSTQIPPFNQTTFCEEQFANESDLKSECKSFSNENQVDGTLESFCELHFGCAQITEENECNTGCAGGSTGLPYYDLCGCFDSDADNYWCNDGGECPENSTTLPLTNFNCQEECLSGPFPSGEGGVFVYQAFNPANEYGYDSGLVINNDLDSCEYSGCMDSDACNYSMNATTDDGSCEYPLGENYDCEGNCIEPCGCTDQTAANYDETAIVDDGGCQYTNYLKIGEITDSTIEILINSDQDIYGFQFDINGIELQGVSSGGIAEESGFTTSNGSNQVLGFSLSGSFIPPTTNESTLVMLNYESLDQNSLCIPTGDNILVISGFSYEEGVSIDISNQFIIHHDNICQ